jgi:hypothetical protein
MSGELRIPVSAGELIDKITILAIKSERLHDAKQRAHVCAELAQLEAVCDRALAGIAALEPLTHDLMRVNTALWEIEDAIRECERKGDFGARFVELARAVYRTNDERAALKRTINEVCGSEIVEEKSYTDY